MGKKKLSREITDTDRLEWIVKHLDVIQDQGKHGWMIDGVTRPGGNFKTFREAFDSAIGDDD